MIRRILLCTLMAVLISVMCAQLPAFAKPLASIPFAAQQDKRTLCTWRAAGIQFIVPTGWELDIDKKGDLQVSKFVGKSSAVVTFGILPVDKSSTQEQVFKRVQEGILSQLKKRFNEVEADKVEEFTQNGMRGRRQVLVGKLDGLGMAGVLPVLIAVLNAEKPIVIYVEISGNEIVTERPGILETIKRIPAEEK